MEGNPDHTSHTAQGWEGTKSYAEVYSVAGSLDLSCFNCNHCA